MSRVNGGKDIFVEPSPRSSKKKDPHRRNRRKSADDDDTAVPGGDSFQATESYDIQIAPRDQTHRSAQSTAGLARSSHQQESSLGNFFQSSDDMSRAKSGNIDDEEASRGAYSTVSKLVKAKKRRKRVVDEGAQHTAAATRRARASVPKATALDLLDEFMTKKQLNTLEDDIAAQEYYREDPSLLRQSGHDDPSQAEMELHRRSINGSKSRSRSHSRRRESSSRHHSPSRRQKGTDSMVRSGSQSDLLDRSSSSLRDSMKKSISLRDTMNKSNSSSRDYTKRSSSVRDVMNQSTSSMRDSMKKSSSKKSVRSKTERKSISSHLKDEERKAGPKSSSSATVSGAPLSRSNSKELLDINKRSTGSSSRHSSSRRHKDLTSLLGTDNSNSHRKSSASVAEPSRSSRRRSSENTFANQEADVLSHLKSKSRSSDKSSKEKSETVEKELLSFLSSLTQSKEPVEPADPDVPSSILLENEETRDRRKHRASSTRSSSQIPGSSRQRSSTSHREERSPRHRVKSVKSILKEPKYRERSSIRLDDSKGRLPTKQDNHDSVELDDHGLFKSPSGRRKSTEDEKDAPREKSSIRTSGSSRRQSNNGNTKSSESTRRRSARHGEAEDGRSSRRRSPSRSRRPSIKGPKEKHSSRRPSTHTSGGDRDKHVRRHSTRSDKVEECDPSKRRGRESKRRDDVRSSHHKSSKKSSRRSMSVQPTSHGHRRQERAHSVDPGGRSGGDFHESVTKAKEHFRSLLKSGSEDAKDRREDATIIPRKILSIRGRFSGEDDDTLPRMEDRTPVSPGASAKSNPDVNEHGQLVLSDGSLPDLPRESGHEADSAASATASNCRVIDLTERVASPVHHIDLTDGVIDVTGDVTSDQGLGTVVTDKVIDVDEHVDSIVGQPCSEYTPDRGSNGSIGTETSIERDNALKPRRGLWGMIRNRMKPSDQSGEPKDDSCQQSEGNATKSLDADKSTSDHARLGDDDSLSRVETDKEMVDSKHGVIVGFDTDAVSDDLTVAMSISQHSANDKSIFGRDHSQSISSFGSSAGSVGSMVSSHVSDAYSSDYQDSDARARAEHDEKSTAAEASLPLPSATVNGHISPLATPGTTFARPGTSDIDGLAPPSVAHGPVVDYDEEDVFSVFSWSAEGQDEYKILQARKALRDFSQATALSRALKRII